MSRRYVAEVRLRLLQIPEEATQSVNASYDAHLEFHWILLAQGVFGGPLASLDHKSPHLGERCLLLRQVLGRHSVRAALGLLVVDTSTIQSIEPSVDREHCLCMRTTVVQPGESLPDGLGEDLGGQADTLSHLAGRLRIGLKGRNCVRGTDIRHGNWN